MPKSKTNITHNSMALISTAFLPCQVLTRRDQLNAKKGATGDSAKPKSEVGTAAKKTKRGGGPKAKAKAKGKAKASAKKGAKARSRKAKAMVMTTRAKAKVMIRKVGKARASTIHLVRVQVVEKAMDGINMAVSRIGTMETTPGIEMIESGRLRRVVQLCMAPRYLRGLRHLRQHLRVERPRRKRQSDSFVSPMRQVRQVHQTQLSLISLVVLMVVDMSERYIQMCLQTLLQ